MCDEPNGCAGGTDYCCESRGCGAEGPRPCPYTSLFAEFDGGGVSGRVLFRELPGGGLAVSAELNYKHSAGTPSYGHKWHVHTSGGDAIDQDDCATAGGHYDPTHKETDTDGNKINGYLCDESCGATPRLTGDDCSSCFKGDLSGRFGGIGVGAGATEVVDSILTLDDLRGRSAIAEGVILLRAPLLRFDSECSIQRRGVCREMTPSSTATAGPSWCMPQPAPAAAWHARRSKWASAVCVSVKAGTISCSTPRRPG
jgi:hypothetical protein